MLHKPLKIPSIAFVLLAQFFVPQSTMAADQYKQFSVRGAGLISCQTYTIERSARSDVYLITAAWVDGYLTASNEYSDNTYDLLSFETTELLTEIIDKHCMQNPKDRIFSVLKPLINKLSADKIHLFSKKTAITVGKRSVSLYDTFIIRVKERLTSAGYYNGKIDGDYGKQTINAVKAYQQSIGFFPSGFPDQATLWRLMRSPK